MKAVLKEEIKICGYKTFGKGYQFSIIEKYDTKYVYVREFEKSPIIKLSIKDVDLKGIKLCKQ